MPAPTRPHVVAVPVRTDPLAPARGVALAAFLGPAVWASGIALALRVIG